MNDHIGKTVIVTGAAGNLGTATALVFAAAGARVALFDREREALEAVRARLPDPASSAAVAVDLLDAQAVAGAVEAVRERFGGIAILANIAGGFAMGPPLHETTEQEWDHMLNLNLRSVFLCTRAVVPHLLERGWGRIVNVAARAATRGIGHMGPYCASKAAIITLTESLADELKHQGVTVNAILPGIIDTPQNRAAMPDQDPGQWVEPAALAEVILFLASDAARAVTGAAVPVYGRG